MTYPPVCVRASRRPSCVSWTGGELRRAFTASVGALLDEAQRVDPDREQRLRETVWELVHSVRLPETQHD